MRFDVTCAFCGGPATYTSGPSNESHSLETDKIAGRTPYLCPCCPCRALSYVFGCWRDATQALFDMLLFGGVRLLTTTHNRMHCEGWALITKSLFGAVRQVCGIVHKALHLMSVAGARTELAFALVLISYRCAFGR